MLIKMTKHCNHSQGVLNPDLEQKLMPVLALISSSRGTMAAEAAMLQSLVTLSSIAQKTLLKPCELQVLLEQLLYERYL